MIADGEILNAPLEDFDLFVNQSREAFDEGELQSLAENIKTNGQLQPGVAWRDPGRSRLVLICGERRYRALRLAGLPTMAVKVIRGSLTPGQMLQINLAENLQRASLNAIERGKSFRRLMQLEDLTASEAAARMNVSGATVSRDLSLLDLPEPLQARVASGELPVSVAAHLARVADDEARRALADQYAGGRINRDGLAAAVGRLLRPRQKAGKPERLALRPGDGLFVTITASEPLTWDGLLAAIDRLRKVSRSLYEGGRPVSELAKALKG